MKLSDEQNAIIEHPGDARITAVAGSGKTSTLLQYALARPSERMLYIVYNRSAKMEALRKFGLAGAHNVTVETAHSLAHRGLNVKNRFELMSTGNLRVGDIAEICNLQASRNQPKFHLLLSRHIQKALNIFCNSSARSFDSIDYLASLSDQKSKDFATHHIDTILGYAKWILSEMFRKRIPVTHDAYLKFYQLGNPSLSRFDAMLFDEGQDASPVMLDIFLRQRGRKLIVGDSSQQIYSFRGAVNSLDQVPFPSFGLTTSFRFRQEVADLAMETLQLKRMIGQYQNPVRIRGVGSCQETESFAVLARTNLCLLREAIESMLFSKRRRLFFEGGFESYTYMSEGASLFDVLYLRLGQFGKIRSSFIREFQDFESLLEYIEAAEDGELRLTVEIVKEFGPSLVDFINRLRQLQVPREQAEVVFSTVHKSKGQEYDCVEILDDFITGEKIQEMLAIARKDPKFAEKLDMNKVAEEINILYVALTRVKNVLMMNFDVTLGSEGEADYYVYNGSNNQGVPAIPTLVNQEVS